jgi:hypothetical protein
MWFELIASIFNDDALGTELMSGDFRIIKDSELREVVSQQL